MKYIVGFSGGIDSTFIAWYLKNQGHEVLLVNLKNTIEPNKCCGLDTDLFNLAKKLGLELQIVNVINQFKELVINYFITQYKIGNTPNPCINCNEYVRFFVLEQIRKKYKFDFITTGHYALTYLSNQGNILKKGSDTKKDQSYMLYRLIDKSYFNNIKFIMGKFKKNDIKKIIIEKNIPHITMKESQNVCFIPDDDYPRYIKQSGVFNVRSGPIYDLNGNYLADHKGIIYYTVGQKKGLNLGKKLYVKKIDYKNNAIIVSEEKDLYEKEILISDFIFYPWLSFEKLLNLVKKGRLYGKIRYHHIGERIKDIILLNDKIKIVFENPVRAPTPGQHLVIYNDNIVVGGGIIL